MSCESMEWIHMAQDTIMRVALTNSALSLPTPYLNSYATQSFWRMHMFHEVNHFKCNDLHMHCQA